MRRHIKVKAEEERRKMAYFSAGQYDQEFAPQRLQMYQVPKYVSSKEPKLAKSKTFIADEKGHLAEGVRRGHSNPFGDFVGTWDMPKTIPGPYNLVKVGKLFLRLS